MFPYSDAALSVCAYQRWNMLTFIVNNYGYTIRPNKVERDSESEMFRRTDDDSEASEQETSKNLNPEEISGLFFKLSPNHI